MKNKDVYIKCSTHNCDILFTEEYFSSGLISHPINNEDKFQQICEGLLKTRLFCIKCCKNNANVICIQSNIPIDNTNV